MIGSFAVCILLERRMLVCCVDVAVYMVLLFVKILFYGGAFFGESMFSRQNNASKAAMLALCQELLERQFMIFDCQVVSPHLYSLGATHMPRSAFASLLEQACLSNAQLNLRRGAHRPITDYLQRSHANT